MAITWKKSFGIVWETGSATKLSCPICRKKRSTYGSSKVSIDGAMLLRYRQCKDCGAAWQTVEIDADRFIDLLEAEETVDVYADKITDAANAVGNAVAALSKATETLGAASRILEGDKTE